MRIVKKRKSDYLFIWPNIWLVEKDLICIDGVSIPLSREHSLEHSDQHTSAMTSSSSEQQIFVILAANRENFRYALSTLEQ